jgi:hypothetical protein
MIKAFLFTNSHKKLINGKISCWEPFNIATSELEVDAECDRLKPASDPKLLKNGSPFNRFPADLPETLSISNQF